MNMRCKIIFLINILIQNKPCNSFTTPQTTLKTTKLKSIPTPIDTLTSGLASIVRFPYGTSINPQLKNEIKSINIIKLYDVENNPKCRLVRECISELDCNVIEVIPCAGDDDAKVPRIVFEDENREAIDLVGTDEILSFFSKYMIEVEKEEGILNNIAAPQWTAYISSIFRYGKGQSITPAAKQRSSSYLPIILYNYENNQFCRLVREVLTELNLPFELKNVAKKSPRRQDDLAKVSIDGSTQCPFIIDPNTNVKMKESKDIILYLYKEYANWTPPNEILQFISNNIMEPLISPLFSKLALPEESNDMESIRSQMKKDISSAPVVVYTYQLSPFCSECTTLLNRLDIPYKEISLGLEWIPGLIKHPEMRVLLGLDYGQTSLPHVFVNGKSIGGLFSGNPGLVPSLEDGSFMRLVNGVVAKK